MNERQVHITLQKLFLKTRAPGQDEGKWQRTKLRYGITRGLVITAKKKSEVFFTIGSASGPATVNVPLTANHSLHISKWRCHFRLYHLLHHDSPVQTCIACPSLLSLRLQLALQRFPYNYFVTATLDLTDIVFKMFFPLIVSKLLCLSLLLFPLFVVNQD